MVLLTASLDERLKVVIVVVVVVGCWLFLLLLLLLLDKWPLILRHTDILYIMFEKIQKLIFSLMIFCYL